MARRLSLAFEETNKGYDAELVPIREAIYGPQPLCRADEYARGVHLPPSDLRKRLLADDRTLVQTNEMAGGPSRHGRRTGIDDSARCRGDVLVLRHRLLGRDLACRKNYWTSSRACSRCLEDFLPADSKRMPPPSPSPRW